MTLRAVSWTGCGSMLIFQHTLVWSPSESLDLLPTVMTSDDSLFIFGITHGNS